MPLPLIGVATSNKLIKMKQMSSFSSYKQIVENEAVRFIV
jgi:hypothetical protein